LSIRTVIAKLNARRDAIEQGGRHGMIANSGKIVGNVANVMIDAEDLLENDEAAARIAARHALIGAYCRAVLGRELDHPPHVALSR
jgi:hypothetical protein